MAFHQQEELKQAMRGVVLGALAQALGEETLEDDDGQPPRPSKKKNLVAFFGEAPTNEERHWTPDPNFLAELEGQAESRGRKKLREAAGPPSSPAIVAEKKERALILSLLLKTGSSLINKNEDLTYLFVSVLPQTLAMIKFWDTNIRRVAIALLEFGLAGMDAGELKWFQLFGVIFPKLLRRVDSVPGLSDPQKADLVVDVARILAEKASQRVDVSDLATFGLDLVFSVRPQASQVSFKEAISLLAKNFAGASTQSSLLFLLQADYDVLKQNVLAEMPLANRLFFAFITKGRRAEIRSFHHICKPSLLRPQLQAIREQLYALADDSGSGTGGSGSNGKATKQKVAEPTTKILLLTELLLPLIEIPETPLSTTLLDPVIQNLAASIPRQFSETDAARVRRELQMITIYSVVGFFFFFFCYLLH